MSPSKSRVVETRYIWAPTIQEAMDKAGTMRLGGWQVHGHPAPMKLFNEYGTGITIIRVTNDY